MYVYLTYLLSIHIQNVINVFCFGMSYIVLFALFLGQVSIKRQNMCVNKMLLEVKSLNDTLMLEKKRSMTVQMATECFSKPCFSYGDNNNNNYNN